MSDNVSPSNVSESDDKKRIFKIDKHKRFLVIFGIFLLCLVSSVGLFWGFRSCLRLSAQNAQALSNLEQEINQGTQQPNFKMAGLFLTLRQNVLAGMPFSEELENLRKEIPKEHQEVSLRKPLSTLEDLSSSRVWSLTELILGFKRSWFDRDSAVSNGVWQRLSNIIPSFAKPKVSEDAEDLNGLEASVRKGDMVAVYQLTQKAPSPACVAGRKWLHEVERFIQAHQALQEMESQ